jgi:hypothetical protein
MIVFLYLAPNRQSTESTDKLRGSSNEFSYFHSNFCCQIRCKYVHGHVSCSLLGSLSAAQNIKMRIYKTIIVPVALCDVKPEKNIGS